MATPNVNANENQDNDVVTNEAKQDDSKTKDFITPNKSPSDDRSYRIVKLKNDMECMLISDPTTEKAACAMSVRVGHFADPSHLPGLAHFLEHMLFLGTEKYPNEAEYKKFLKAHGGSSNASTGMHDTCFQFDVGSEYLEPAMDRFSQFFISPLFTEGSTERELNAVDSENSNNQQSDAHRLYQFDKSLTNEAHPFHKFGTGNLKTLKVDENTENLRKELLQFHSKYYSSSCMKLAIYGKESLDVLHEYVVDKFGAVVNKSVNEPMYLNELNKIYDSKQYPCLFKIAPIQERRELRLNWMLPSCYLDTLSQPTSLISYCLGDEAKGSILSYLKKCGYATELCAGLSYNLPEFAMMQITVKLSPEGLKEWQTVVDCIYKYISEMNALKLDDWMRYFSERSNVRKMNFDFKGKEKPYGYSRKLAMQMHKNYPKNMLLECIGGKLFKFDYEQIDKYLSFLNVDNCYYQLITSDFEKECVNKEPWYQTPFKREELDVKMVSKWKKSLNGEFENDEKKNTELFTPPPNPYIASNFDILENKETENDKNPFTPAVLRENANSKIWFKQDSYFSKPKLCVSINLFCPFLNDSVLSMSLTDLLLLILNDQLSDFTYVFEEASLSYSASFGGSSSISFKFAGFHEKLHLLIEQVLQLFLKLELNESSYEINKEKLFRSIVSMKKSQPYQHTDMIDTLFLCPKAVSIADLENAFKQITFDKLKKQKERIFEKMYIESLIYGNINSEMASQQILDGMIDKYLLSQCKEKYTFSELVNDRKGCLSLEFGKEYLIQFACPNGDDENSCIGNNYMFTVDTPSDYAVLKLFSHLVNAPCFDELRTKQQLGYIVWSFPDFVRGFLSFRVLVQSKNTDPCVLDDKIEEFLNSNFKDVLLKLSDEELELNKKSVINNLMQKPKTIYEQNNRFWAEIKSARYDFERRVHLCKEIEKLKKENLMQFFNTFVATNDENKSQRCKLSVQCFGNQHKCPDESDDKNEKKKDVIRWRIEDVEVVREKCGYSPFPYTDNSKL